MTKKIVLIALFAVGSSYTSEAQNIKADKVPTPVKEALTKAYPNAKEIEWNKEAAIIMKGGKTMYEAEVGKKDLLFDVEGNLIK
jgi:hypothetical protein